MPGEQVLVRVSIGAVAENIFHLHGTQHRHIRRVAHGEGTCLIQNAHLTSRVDRAQLHQLFKGNEMISFTTNDRAAAGTDGSMEYLPCSAICNDYQLASNGIKYPTKFQAVGNVPAGDFVYFDGVIREVSYGYEK